MVPPLVRLNQGIDSRLLWPHRRVSGLVMRLDSPGAEHTHRLAIKIRKAEKKAKTEKMWKCGKMLTFRLDSSNPTQGDISRYSNTGDAHKPKADTLN